MAPESASNWKARAKRIDERLSERPLYKVTKRAAKEFSDDQAFTHGAAVAYYAIFSIAPLLVLSIVVAGFVLGPAAARGEVVGMLDQHLGQNSAELIQSMMASAYDPAGGIIATVLGIVTLLFAASALFNQLQRSMNVIWEVRPAKRSIKDAIVSRLTTFGMVLLVGALLLVSLIASALLSAVSTYFPNVLPAAINSWVLQLLYFVLALLVTTILFAVLFRYLPQANVAWKDVWTGAIITATLFSVGRVLIGIYMARSAPGSTYGAAGAVIVLLLWIFYSALIFFFGAEITQVYANLYGSHIRPEEGGRSRTGEEPEDRNRPSRPGAGAS